MAFGVLSSRSPSPLHSRIITSSFARLLIVITLWIAWAAPSAASSQSLHEHSGPGHRIHHVHPPVHYTADEHHSDGEYPAQGDKPATLDDVVDEYYNPLFQSNAHVHLSPLTGHSDEDQEHDFISGVLSKRQQQQENGEDTDTQDPAKETVATDQLRRYNQNPGLLVPYVVTTESIFQDAGKPGSPNVFVDEENNVRMRTVYINLNTCTNPTPSNTTKSIAPNLAIFVSNATGNRNPGPTSNPRQTIVVPVIEGFANLTLNVSSPLYFSVLAPNITEDMGNFTGFYNYELMISTKKQYYGYLNVQNLYLIDSDSSNALLISGNETAYDKIANVSSITPPYTFFAHPANSTSLFGLRRSWCGLRDQAQLSRLNGQVSMTRRGLGNKVKEQIYLTGLSPNTTYHVWLAKQNNETAGGFVYAPVNLTTKSDGNCRVIYDLDFCSEVAYAVPTNNTVFQSMPRLARFYDTYASSWYANFSYSLQQVQCNTTSDRAYSHLRGCDDCDKAYKNWLCATTIPRCADYSSKARFLATREMTNGSQTGPTKAFLDDDRIVDILSPAEPDEDGTTGGEDDTNDDKRFQGASRNVLIDQVVSPGRYKEIKPCMDLCWSLVQSCPASLGFTCPRGARGDMAYGWRSNDGDITCSYLGAAYFLSDSVRSRVAVGKGGVWAFVIMVGAGLSLS